MKRIGCIILVVIALLVVWFACISTGAFSTENKKAIWYKTLDAYAIISGECDSHNVTYMGHRESKRFNRGEKITRPCDPQATMFQDKSVTYYVRVESLYDGKIFPLVIAEDPGIKAQAKIGVWERLPMNQWCELTFDKPGLLDINTCQDEIPKPPY